MICPRCDGQGLVYKAKIVNLGIELNICDECDACWPLGQRIGIENFNNLSTFLEQQGTTYRNAKIEDLGYLENETETDA